MQRSIESHSASGCRFLKLMTPALRLLFVVLLLLALAIFLPVLRVGATSWSVTDTATLNAAIASANTETSGTHTINFEADIVLTDATTPIDLQLGVTLVIEGQGYSLDGAATYRGLTIGSGTVEIHALTITNGLSLPFGGGIHNAGELTVVDSTISDNQSNFGGGIYNSNSLTILNSILSGNNADDHGGGVYTSTGTLTISNNSDLSGNTAIDGAAIYIDTGEVDITDSTLIGNVASNKGGGIYIDTGDAEVIGSLLSGNNALVYGGGIYQANGTLTVKSSLLSANASDIGGGIGTDSGEVRVIHSALSNNSALIGGGIYNNSYMAVVSSTISGNTAGSSGGGITNWTDSYLTLVNVTLRGNAAFDGGGTELIGGPANLYNVMFDSNTANNEGGGLDHRGDLMSLVNVTFANNSANRGGAIFSQCDYWSTAVVQNSIIWSNSAAELGSQIYARIGSVGEFSLSHSLVQELYADGVYVENDPINDDGSNLTDSPKFVDAAHGDLRLWRDSPAVNAGNNGFLPPDATDLDQDGNTIEPLPLDIDGHPRVWNTTVDMGAHEAPSQAVLYVKPGASGDCTSWSQACGLHTALNWTVPADAGRGEVWVAAGIYIPTSRTEMLDPRSVTFQLHRGAALYGGFTGDEISLDQRDPIANITVLSGDIDGDDITDSHGVVTDPAYIQGANSYHVLSALGVDDTALLDGLTITGGSADGGDPHHRGGGMLNDGGSPMLRNVAFWGNRAQTGAGLVNLDGAAPFILNSIFGGNSATNGGGMRNDGSSPTLVNVIFNANTASGLAGGMFNAGGSLTEMVNLTFTHNQAGQGGALANENSSPTLANSILWANGATLSGDQIFNDGSTPAIRHSLVQDSGGSGLDWDASLGSDGGGNLDQDPLFMDADGADDAPGTLDDDLRLQVNSPAIDAGDNDSLPMDDLDLDVDGDSLEPFPYDMDEQDRIFPNSDQLATVIPDVFARLEFCESYCIVNMGPYEAPPVAGYQEYMLAFLEGEYHLLEGQKYRRGFHVELDGQPEKTISEIVANVTPSVIDEFNQARTAYLSATNLAEQIGLSPQVPRARYLEVHWELSTAAMLLGNDDMVLAMDFITQLDAPPLDEEIGHIQDAIIHYQLATDTYLELVEGEGMDLLAAAQPTRIQPVGVSAGEPAPCLDLQRLAMASAQKSRAYLELVERQFRKYTPASVETAKGTLEEGVLTARSDLALMGALMQAVDGGICEAPGGAASFTLEDDESYFAILHNIVDMERLFDYLVEEKNPFGFDEAFVPFHFQPKVWIRDGLNNYEQTKVLADDELALAEDMVIAAEDARQAFDDNQETLALRMEQVQTQYESQMVQLCGLNDSDDPDLEGCHQNTAGEVYQQLQRVVGASERVNLVILQMEHQLDLIRIEQERAARVAGIQRATAEMYLETGEKLADLASEIANLRFAKDNVQGAMSILQSALGGAAALEEGPAGGWGAIFGGIVGSTTEAANYEREQKNAEQIAEKEAEMERLRAFQSAQVHYAEAEITDANSEAQQKQYFLRYQEYAVELAIARANMLQELARLDGLRTRLAYLLSEKAGSEAYTEGIYADPAFRVMRDTLMELAYSRYGVALEYAYRAARALEYEINQDAVFTDGEWTELESLYATRDVTTLQAGLGQMNTAYQEFLARPDVPFPQLREDVIYLSQALGFEDTFEPELGRVVTREEKFNAFVRDPANRGEDGNLRFTFQTSISLGNRFFSTAVFNDKIVSIKMRVRGQDLGDDRIVISLKQSGTSFLRTLNAFSGGGPDDVRAYNLHALRATIMAATNENVLPDDIADNMELATRSVAFTNWTLTLDQIHEPNNFDVDINGIEEIEMTITHEAYTLQDVGGVQVAGAAEGDEDRSIFDPPPNRPYQPIEETDTPWYRLRSLISPDVAMDTAPFAPDELTGVFTGTAIVTDPVYIPNMDLVLYLEDTDGNLEGCIEASILAGFPENAVPCPGVEGINGIPVSGSWDGFQFSLHSEVFINPTTCAERQVFFDGEFDDGGQFLIGTYSETLTGLTADPLTLTGVFRLSFSLTLTSARTIYVDDDASGANNGASWQDAFTELGQALEFAQAGDEIWVAQGSYLPDYDTESETHTGERTAAFRLKNDVALYGGFAGTETERDDRDWVANPTILSGDIGVQGETNDNSYHVVIASGTNTTAILDGFTISAGNADGTWPNDGGGGLLVSGGNPTLVNLIVMDNDAAKGGGMQNAGAIPTLYNVAFIGNSSVNGGGMYNAQSHPMLSNVTFMDNHAANGAGMSNVSGSSPELVNVAFIGNQATGNGGGLINLDGSSPDLSNVLFSGNQAQRGGGLYNDDSDPILVNVTLSGNTASVHGGGMENWHSDPPLANTIFWDNDAPESPQIYNASSAPEIRYSLIQGALSSGDWDPDLGIDAGHNLDQDPMFVDADGADDLTGTSDDELRLQIPSPAIDAGDNAAVLIGVVTDLAGSARFIDVDEVEDTGLGAPPMVDMGAYECTGPLFNDVPWDHWARDYIEAIYNAGITSGCGGGNYCPNQPVSRTQVAKFLLVAEHGAGYTPPAGIGTMFADVPPEDPFVDWIEQFANEGMTSGCGGGNFCPDLPVSRAQIAKFLLIAEHGSSYTPPAGTGTMFADVDPGYLFLDWIEQLANEGVTSGCGGGNYCPDLVVARDQMAVFLVRTFDLPMP